MNSVVLFLSAIRENDRFLARVGGKVFDSRSRILLPFSFEAFTKTRTMIKVVGRSTLEKIVRSFQISIGTS